jgi:pimeloyl-ACP methyl ester carboxylesterase
MSPDPSEDPSRIPCPSLVVWGDRDPYLATRIAEAFVN